METKFHAVQDFEVKKDSYSFLSHAVFWFQSQTWLSLIWHEKSKWNRKLYNEKDRWCLWGIWIKRSFRKLQLFFLSYMPHFLYFELNNQWTFNKDLLYHQSLSMMYSRRDTISKTLKYSSSHTCQGLHRDNRQQLIHFLSFFWSCFIPIFQQFLRVHRPFEKKSIFRSSNEMYVTFLLEKLMH